MHMRSTSLPIGDAENRAGPVFSPLRLNIVTKLLQVRESRLYRSHPGRRYQLWRFRDALTLSHPKTCGRHRYKPVFQFRTVS